MNHNSQSKSDSETLNIQSNPLFTFFCWTDYQQPIRIRYPLTWIPTANQKSECGTLIQSNLLFIFFCWTVLQQPIRNENFTLLTHIKNNVNLFNKVFFHQRLVKIQRTYNNNAQSSKYIQLGTKLNKLLLNKNGTNRSWSSKLYFVIPVLVEIKIAKKLYVYL